MLNDTEILNALDEIIRRDIKMRQDIVIGNVFLGTVVPGGSFREAITHNLEQNVPRLIARKLTE